MQSRKLQCGIWRESMKPSLRFSSFCVFFVCKGKPFWLLFYSTVAGVVPCGGRKKSPRTSSLCRLYLIPFGIIAPILGILKIEYRFSRRKWVWRRGSYAASQTTMLHMKRLKQTVSPFFVILCVICFQTQLSFLTFIELECAVDGVPSQIPTLVANVANGLADWRTDGRSGTPKPWDHVASLIKFRPVV